MTIASRAALAGAFAALLMGSAQAQSPQIPTPANTNPANPVASDGSPLPHHNVGGAMLSGRSAYVAPVGGIVGAGLGTAGSLVGSGLGLANGAVGTGLDATGAAVGTVAQPLR